MLFKPNLTTTHNSCKHPKFTYFISTHPVAQNIFKEINFEAHTVFDLPS